MDFSRFELRRVPAALPHLTPLPPPKIESPVFMAVALVGVPEAVALSPPPSKPPDLRLSSLQPSAPPTPPVPPDPPPGFPLLSSLESVSILFTVHARHRPHPPSTAAHLYLLCRSTDLQAPLACKSSSPVSLFLHVLGTCIFSTLAFEAVEDDGFIGSEKSSDVPWPPLTLDAAASRLSLPEARSMLSLALESLDARALPLVSQDHLASMSCFLQVRVKVIGSFQVDCLGWSSVALLTALVRLVAAVCSLFHDVSFMYPAISSFSTTFLIFNSLRRWCPIPFRLCSSCPSHLHHRFSSHPTYEPPWSKLLSRIPPPSDDSQHRLPSIPLEFQVVRECWVHLLPDVFFLSALAFSGHADVDRKLGVVVSTSMYGYLFATLVPFAGILIALVRSPTAVCSLIPTFESSGGNLIALV